VLAADAHVGNLSSSSKWTATFPVRTLRPGDLRFRDHQPKDRQNRAESGQGMTTAAPRRTAPSSSRCRWSAWHVRPAVAARIGRGDLLGRRIIGEGGVPAAAAADREILRKRSDEVGDPENAGSGSFWRRCPGCHRRSGRCRKRCRHCRPTRRHQHHFVIVGEDGGGAH